MRSTIGLICLAVVAVACGNDPTGITTSEPIGAAELATVSSAPGGTEVPSTTALSQITSSTATDASLAPTGEPRVIETELGQVRYTLPPGPPDRPS